MAFRFSFFRANHERIGPERRQLDRLRQRQRWLARQQPVRDVVVASAGVDRAVCAHDHGSHRR